MQATIKDVAREAGVSIKTVSRVLNEERYVGHATRHRVEDAIAALNFRPRSAARVLAGGRSFQIGLICDNPSPYYVYEMQYGVRDRCEQSGVRMIAQPYDRASDQLVGDLEGLLDSTSVDGLILTPPVTDRADVLALLDKREVRFVRVSPGHRAGLAPATFIDNHAAAAQLTRHLIGLGHERIGFVSGHPSYATSAQRRAGFEAAMAEAGLTCDPALICEGDFDFASGAAAGDALLSASRPPTAIFASNDDMAAGVLMAAHRRGIAVPAALSVVGFGDDRLAGYVWPPLTTIRQPTRELGFQAADLLLARTANGPPEQRQLAYELVVRDSTGKVPA